MKPGHFELHVLFPGHQGGAYSRLGTYITNCFGHQGGCFFEVGGYSSLRAYSNKYGMFISWTTEKEGLLAPFPHFFENY